MNAYRCCGSADEAIIPHITIAITCGPVMFLIVIHFNLSQSYTEAGKNILCFVNLQAITGRYAFSTGIFALLIFTFFYRNKIFPCTAKKADTLIFIVNSWSTF